MSSWDPDRWTFGSHAALTCVGPFFLALVTEMSNSESGIWTVPFQFTPCVVFPPNRQRDNNLIFFIMIILFHIFLQLFAKREDNNVHKEIQETIFMYTLYSGYKDNNTLINT